MNEPVTPADPLEVVAVQPNGDTSDAYMTFAWVVTGNIFGGLALRRLFHRVGRLTNTQATITRRQSIGLFTCMRQVVQWLTFSPKPISKARKHEFRTNWAVITKTVRSDEFKAMLRDKINEKLR